MKVLVAGASEVDAGKTTFTVGFVERTGVRAYKPRAGNDYWYDHDDVRRAAADGRLYGKDAARLAAVSPADVTPEAINPVHRLWLPRPGGGTGLLGREGRDVLLDRVRVPAAMEGDPDAGRRPQADGDAAALAGPALEAETGVDHYVTNDAVDPPASARRALPLEAARTVASLPALNEVMATLHAPALSRLGDAIDAAPAAAVESYADIARPLEAFTPDAVAVVEPRRCRVYDGERYARACDVASGSAHEGRLEERVDRVVGLLDARARVSLPVLAADERDDPAAIVSAYEPAYDALLEAV